MVYPILASIAPLPVDFMPDSVRADYDEAREVLASSPRSACALLRLCVQKICIHLGKPGKSINNDIGELVKEGLSERLQRALDTVRVVGNNAVHPGEISVEDNPDLARFMFDLVNLVTDDLIGKYRRLDRAFEALPDGAKESISVRDKPTSISNQAKSLNDAD